MNIESTSLLIFETRQDLNGNYSYGVYLPNIPPNHVNLFVKTGRYPTPEEAVGACDPLKPEIHDFILSSLRAGQTVKIDLARALKAI